MSRADRQRQAGMGSQCSGRQRRPHDRSRSAESCGTPRRGSEVSQQVDWLSQAAARPQRDCSDTPHSEHGHEHASRQARGRQGRRNFASEFRCVATAHRDRSIKRNERTTRVQFTHDHIMTGEETGTAHNTTGEATTNNASRHDATAERHHALSQLRCARSLARRCAVRALSVVV